MDANIFLKAVYISVGVILSFNAIVATVVSNFNTGVLATYIIGFCALFYGLFLEKALKLPVVVNVLFLVLVAVGFTLCISLLLYGKADTVDYEEDAVIVLGAGIKGETVGNSLRMRLDTAVEYHEKNSDAVIVVSGGQGRFENITEALAMERYLLERGVPARAIVKEECSTSTSENFLFSKRLLDERFEGEYSVAYISNSFHIYRAGKMAQDAGFQRAAHLGADTPWYLVIPSTFRECMAAIRYWIS